MRVALKSAVRVVLFILLVPVGLLVLGGIVGRTAVAQDLRIETDIFADGEQHPDSHTVTLLDSNTVYDFLESPETVTVFRAPTPARDGQFILLDVKTEKRTEISTSRIEALIAKLSLWAGEQEDPLLKFAADPQFDEKYDANTGMLQLVNPLWSYHVATVAAEDRHGLNRYREFTDWYARLNTMLHNSTPPGPRLALNASLERHNVVPVEIRRTIDQGKSTVRAVHLFTWRLSRQDRARLEEVRRMLSTFEKVTNEQFLTLTNEPATVRGQSRQ